jgi:hypothetical protein
MNLEQKINRAVCFSVVGLISFGLWQGSVFAALWMFVVLMIACGGVIALQHCITRAIQGKPTDE